ncbi:hypothetical protein [Nocardia sp. alder85J]|uniref:hypothetical protein n=1 Tax=Nocardia sp. alder85J TaxID=2862949 RepID=UPI001CD700B0|nr:hypothetical protein [Nocardia sp. alder85J]MCX4093254.1 hypothetical protein [Nocardia sp. alder85J]
MQLRSVTAAATLVVGALAATAGVTHADPAAAQPEVRYSAKLVDKKVVTTLKDGTFALAKARRADLADGKDVRLTERDGGLFDPDGKATAVADAVDVVDVRDTGGHTVATLPLDVHVVGLVIPVAPTVKDDGTVLELSPQRPTGLDISQPLALNPGATKPVAAQAIASDAENQKAMSDFSTKFSLATAVGGFIGTALGATIGCVVTIAAGCVAGLVTGAGVGGIVGTIAAGGPTLIATGLDLVGTMQAADGTTHYADKPTLQPSPGQDVAAHGPANPQQQQGR